MCYDVDAEFSLVQGQGLRELHELRKDVRHEVQLVDFRADKVDVLHDALPSEDRTTIEPLVGRQQTSVEGSQDLQIARARFLSVHTDMAGTCRHIRTHGTSLGEDGMQLVPREQRLQRLVHLDNVFNDRLDAGRRLGPAPLLRGR